MIDIGISSIKPSWLVVWNMFYFPTYWEFHHPNWLIFFRGACPTTSQLVRVIIPDSEKFYTSEHRIRVESPLDHRRIVGQGVAAAALYFKKKKAAESWLRLRAVRWLMMLDGSSFDFLSGWWVFLEHLTGRFCHESWEFHHPNWRTHIFQRGTVGIPPTSSCFLDSDVNQPPLFEQTI